MNRKEFESRARLGATFDDEDLTFRATLGGKIHLCQGSMRRGLCGRDTHKVNASRQIHGDVLLASVVRDFGFDRLCVRCVDAFAETVVGE
ncbi:MAG: hypothetical protein ACTSX8_03565 [Alphaproteobacteria bacterium]